MNYIKAELINYFDVWGNEEDGFEVNNLCSEGKIGLPEKFTDEDILAGLKRKNMLKEWVTTEHVEIHHEWYPMIEIHEKETEKPLFSLRFEY